MGDTTNFNGSERERGIRRVSRSTTQLGGMARGKRRGVWGRRPVKPESEKKNGGGEGGKKEKLLWEGGRLRGREKGRKGWTPAKNSNGRIFRNASCEKKRGIGKEWSKRLFGNKLRRRGRERKLADVSWTYANNVRGSKKRCQGTRETERGVREQGKKTIKRGGRKAGCGKGGKLEPDERVWGLRVPVFGGGTVTPKAERWQNPQLRGDVVVYSTKPGGREKGVALGSPGRRLRAPWKEAAAGWIVGHRSKSAA